MIEQFQQITSVIFDKTGTITANKETSIAYEGSELSEAEEMLLKSSLRNLIWYV